jgi:hypothetical protein
MLEQQCWLQASGSTHTSWVTLGKLLNLSGPNYLFKPCLVPKQINSCF